MSLESVLPIIKELAPTLATIIGGPVGGIATVGIKILSEVFGANPDDTHDIANKIANDPDAEMKIKKLEDNVEVKKLAAQTEEREFEDIQDARALQESNFRHVLFGFLVITLVVSLYLTATMHENKEILTMLVPINGLIIGGLWKVISLYFGKSKT